MSVAEIVARLVGAYLLGSLSGSLLIGRLRGVDVRTQGSGNAGGTNAFRTQGWRFALAVVVIDIGKGALAVWLAQRGADAASALPIGMAAGAAAVLGHVWPVFFRFRGGKGAATLIGALLMLWPLLLLIPALTWLLLMTITGYVGLSTMIAGAMLVPVAAWAAAPHDRLLWIAAAVVVASFLIFTHRSNIQRLRAGNEHRFERIRVIARWWAGRR